MSADRIVYNFEALNSYIKRTEVQCAGLSERQAAIETAYNRLIECWKDNIYVRAGDIISETARNIKRIYDGLRASAAEVVRLYNGLCAYNNRSSDTLSVRIPDFVTKVIGGEFMNINAVSDPEVMYAFLRQLRAYIVDTQNAVNEIKRRHADMAQYWQGKHYNAMTECLNEVGRQIAAQLEKLTYLLEYVRRKYVELCATLGVNARAL